MLDATSNVRARSYPAPDEMPSSFVCRRLFIPDDPGIIAAVNDVIAYLCGQRAWEASENVSVLDMEALMTDMWFDFAGDDCDE